MSALTLISPADGIEQVSDLSESALDYGRAALSANTMRAYGGDWEEFQTWCSDRSRGSLPASLATVANFASALAGAGKKVPTIARKLAAIRFFHRVALDKRTRPTMPACRPSSSGWSGVGSVRGIRATDA